MLNALAYALSGVSSKTKTTLPFEILQRMDESLNAFPDQIKNRHSMVAITLGYINHQAQVLRDHLLLHVWIVNLDKVYELKLQFMA